MKKEFNLEREIRNIKILVVQGVFMICALVALGVFAVTGVEHWNYIASVFAIGLIITFIGDLYWMWKWKKEDKIKLESSN